MENDLIPINPTIIRVFRVMRIARGNLIQLFALNTLFLCDLFNIDYCCIFIHIPSSRDYWPNVDSLWITIEWFWQLLGYGRLDIPAYQSCSEYCTGEYLSRMILSSLRADHSLVFVDKWFVNQRCDKIGISYCVPMWGKQLSNIGPHQFLIIGMFSDKIQFLAWKQVTVYKYY